MKRNIFSVLTLILILVSACTPAPTATPTPLEPTAVPPTATLAATAVPPTATITPTPTDAPPTPTDPPTAAPTATTAPLAKCVYSATLVSEDPQDNQQLTVNESFTKTWTLKNSGNCAWDGTSWKLTAANAPGDTTLNDSNGSAYRMDDLSNPKKNVVIVGDSISLSMPMKAPDHWGTFTQNWQLIDSDTNQIMAITNGSSAQTIYARIVVPDSSGGSSGGSQKPTVEIQNIALQDGAVACTNDARYNIAAKIIGKAGAQVSYTVSTDGNGTPLDAGATVTLNKKGGYDINTAITGAYSNAGTVQITITVLLDGQAVNYAAASICQGGVYQQ